MTKFMTFQKKRTLYKAFVKSQFKYSPLNWMFHGCQETNYKINRLQEQALRSIYNDLISSFKELLSMDDFYNSWAKYSEFGYRNIQSIKWSFNSWFFRTISVKWVIIWLKVKWTLKTLYSQYQLCYISNIKVLFNTLVQWSGILY